MIDDVDQLLWKQARVNRMTHVATAGGRVVGFKMAIIIPCQGGNAITLRQVPPRDGVGQLTHATKGLPVGVTMTGVVVGHRNNFGTTVYRFCVLDN